VVERAIQAEQHFLRDVIGIVLVPRMHQRPAVHGRLAAAQQLVPRRDVAGPSALHERIDRVVQLPGIAHPRSEVAPRVE
jgi:hypothetical protein